MDSYRWASIKLSRLKGLDVLHNRDEDLVYGDFCRQNIMISDATGEIKFIVFDWAATGLGRLGVHGSGRPSHSICRKGMSRELLTAHTPGHDPNPHCLRLAARRFFQPIDITGLSFDAYWSIYLDHLAPPDSFIFVTPREAPPIDSKSPHRLNSLKHWSAAARGYYRRLKGYLINLTIIVN
ncbi:hypothetical protein IW262DRAFT_777372 [Armillaria fumosa]|nr:hypothetical protein IW262DRAFT_777372 [Armillaria fumosa]